MPYIVLAYDIADDRRRDRLVRRLTDDLVRVQESVFEGFVGDRRHVALMAAVNELIDHRSDNVRVYTLCQRCRVSVETMGVAITPANPEDDVVL